MNTRFNARCVLSSFWNDAGHGMELVTGFEDVEGLCDRTGASLALAVRRGFAPLS